MCYRESLSCAFVDVHHDIVTLRLATLPTTHEGPPCTLTVTLTTFAACIAPSAAGAVFQGTEPNCLDLFCWNLAADATRIIVSLKSQVLPVQYAVFVPVFRNI